MGMNTGSHKAQVEIRARTTDANKNIQKLANQVNKLGVQVDRLSVKNKKAAATFNKLEAHAKTLRSGAMAVGAAVIGAVYTLDRLAERQVEVSNVNNKLRISVDAAANAVSNQTSKFELATHAAKLNSQGIATSSEDYAKLTGMVAQLADAHGVDLNQALAQTTKAILKGNTRGLEQLGIYGDMSFELDQYAKKMGKSTTEVTLAEKQQLALNLIMKDGQMEAAALGETVESTAHEWVAFKNKAINLIDELNDKLWTLDDTASETLNDGVRWWFELIGRDAEHAALGVWQVNEAIEQMGKEAQRALAFVAPLVSIQYGGDFTGTSMQGGDFTDLANSLKDGSAGRLAAAQKTAADFKADQAKSREIMANARAVQVAFRNAMAASGEDKGGKGGRKKKAEELYEAELRRILLMDREIEKLEALGKSTEALERHRFELAHFVARAKGDEAKAEELSHKRALARIQLQQEWDQKRAENTVRRLEQEGLVAQQRAEIEAQELQGKLIGEENEVAAHRVRMEIAAVEAESLQGELDTRRQILEARFPADEAERMEIQQELQSLDHEQRMAMLVEEQERRQLGHELQQKIEEQAEKARQKRLESIRATARMSDSVLSASADIAQISADRGNAAGEKAAKAFMKVRGIMAIAQGAFDTAQAVSSFASFNYVQGALYIASAATNFATGAKLVAGNPGGGSGGASVSGGPLGDNRYQGSPGEAPSATTRSGSPDPTAVPRSVPDDENGTTGGLGSAGSSSNGPTIVVQGDVVGDVNEKWTKKLSKNLDRQKYSGKVKA